MVDIPISQTPEGESSKIKKLMGHSKPGILKSKFLTVLGNSNELLNRLSNKLDITLDLSSSDSDYCDDDEEEQPDETVDFSTIDFDARRVKARRAQEEIISGRFRHPNLVPKMTQTNNTQDGQKPISSSSSSSDNSSRRSSSYSNNSIDSKSPNHGDTDIEEELNDILDVSLADTPAIDIIPPSQTTPPQSSINLSSSAPERSNLDDDDQIIIPASDTMTINLTANGLSTTSLAQATVSAATLNHNLQKTSNSSTLTSLNDPAVPITASLESSDIRNYIRSESQNSVPSWASSISLDSHTEETVREFMKEFIEILFTNCSQIGLELKSEFGLKARQNTGRLWFARFVTAQRAKSKRTDETTFYSLVQYFAIILFECAESEDYSPAKNLMNMCFTFYHEIEVPGCEPYREYLFTYLRQQPIWHTLRFWNAAFFDALQCERVHHPVPNNTTNKNNKINNDKKLMKKISLPQSDNDESISSASEHNEDVVICNDFKEDVKYQQNITFGQLGTFTCNMHAFGLSKDLCMEFLKKQSAIANLRKDQVKLLRENINRMYHETDKWGA